MTYRAALNKSFKALYDGCLNLILPRWCCACGAKLNSRRDLLCLDCWEQLPIQEKMMEPNNETERIFWGAFPIVRGMALFAFEPKGVSGTLIHEIKYNHRKDLARALGRLMAQQFLARGLLDGIDVIIPVPLHWRRQWSRGYNQSNELAKGLSAISGIPVLSNAIKRGRNNRSQTKMNRDERWNNVKGLFALVEGNATRALEGKHILLVDDVITTGATLTAIGMLVDHEIPRCRISVAGAARPLFF